MRGASALCLVVLLSMPVLAGCVDVSSSGDAGTEKDDASPLRTRPATPAERAARTLEALPALARGETFEFRYWHVRSGIDTTLEVTVADHDDGTYGFGFLAGAEAHGATDALITHVPPLGPVNDTNLAWRVHEKTFQPLAFPLALGTTWDTTWQNANDAVTAEVVAVDGQNASIEMIGSARRILLEYSAYDGMITRFEVVDYGGFELIARHDAPIDEVLVPGDHAPVILDSRVQGVTGRDGQPASPSASYVIDPRYTAAATLVMLGTTRPDLPSRQAVHLTSAPQEGLPVTNQRVFVPGSSNQFDAILGYVESPGGTWEFVYDGEGVGTFATIEFIGYVGRTVALPTRG